jgi:hypothetical protein
MTNPSEFRDPQGMSHADGTFEYARIYGNAVADVMTKAVQVSEPVKLVPFAVAARPIAIPVENRMYRAARELGVLKRAGLSWNGDPERITPMAGNATAGESLAMETEVAYLRLGDLHIAGIPGELYPESVYGKVQNPVDPNADFPDAPMEPSIAQSMPGKKWLIIGLANDEIGYIIPTRSVLAVRLAGSARSRLHSVLASSIRHRCKRERC